jgi:bifunctional DNA-binding transcriptional regulator/antitoxin component of YhaV-PrlF toxin-antitoxin module
MAKVTSKLQVTLPKALAVRYGIRPGDEIEWQPAGDGIRIVARTQAAPPDVALRRRLFDLATERQRQRERERPMPREEGPRDWTREDLYDDRGSSR